jgi:hypothetical protein
LARFGAGNDTAIRCGAFRISCRFFSNRRHYALTPSGQPRKARQFDDKSMMRGEPGGKARAWEAGTPVLSACRKRKIRNALT